jgi:hypothetical protein
MFRFSSVEHAAGAPNAIEYDHHGRAAREIAETLFDFAAGAPSDA